MTDRWIARLVFSGAIFMTLACGGCASLHHYELADIDNSKKARAFEIQLDETGVDAEQAMRLAKLAAADRKTKERLSSAENVWALTHVGYTTGKATFSDDWADGLLARILERCPSGHVTGLNVQRESADYPVVSGEIVTVKGFCVE